MTPANNDVHDGGYGVAACFIDRLVRGLVNNAQRLGLRPIAHLALPNLTTPYLLPFLAGADQGMAKYHF